MNEPFGRSDHRLVVLGRARWTIVATSLAHPRSDPHSNTPMLLVLRLQRFIAREQELLEARGSCPTHGEHALQAHKGHLILGPGFSV